MNLLSVDEERCTRDQICVEECPALAIEVNDATGLPEPVAGAEALCVQCGHCVAVCPNGALDLATMTSGECEPIRREVLPGPKQVEHLLRSRRSIRAYQGRTLDRVVLTRLIEIARYAPSAHNRQPVRWLIVESRSEVERLTGIVAEYFRYLIEERPALAQSLDLARLVDGWEKGRDPISRGAPHIVVTYASKEVPSASVDCASALTHLELAASSMGLGACWHGFFYAAAASFPPLFQALRLPEGHQVFGAMMLGHPRHRYHRIPCRNEPSIEWR